MTIWIGWAVTVAAVALFIGIMFGYSLLLGALRRDGYHVEYASDARGKSRYRVARIEHDWLPPAQR